MAAPGIYALNNNIDRLSEDILNAQHVFNMLNGKLKNISMQKEVQSNILVLNLLDCKVSPKEFCPIAEERGLLIRPILNNSVRLIFYKGIDKSTATEAGDIILDLDKII